MVPIAVTANANALMKALIETESVEIFRMLFLEEAVVESLEA